MSQDKNTDDGVHQSVQSALNPRFVGFVLFVPSITVLSIALYLEPDASGMGTHQQLGLQPCGFWALSGIPCPMCGMTTTFTHFAHFQFVEGFLNQPFGSVLFITMILALVIGLLDLITGKGWYRLILRWIADREVLIVMSMVIGLILGWGYKIYLVNGHLFSAGVG